MPSVYSLGMETDSWAISQYPPPIDESLPSFLTDIMTVRERTIPKMESERATMASTGAAAAAAVIANAIKASGVLITVEPSVFEMIASRQEDPLIVHAMGGVFWSKHVYLVSYKGLAFTTKSVEILDLPPGSELIESKSIAIPG